MLNDDKMSSSNFLNNSLDNNIMQKCIVHPWLQGTVQYSKGLAAGLGQPLDGFDTIL